MLKIPKINCKNVFFHLIFLTFLYIIAILPQYWYTKAAPPNTFYTRVNRNLQDYYYDISIIRQGKNAFEEINQYTTEDDVPLIIHLFYLAIGRIGGILGISPFDTYYYALYFSLAIFYLFSYLLVKKLFPPSYRFLCLLIIFFASPLRNFPINILGREYWLGTSWWTQTDVYGRLTERPHHSFSMALMVATTYCLFGFLSQKKYSHLTLTILFCSAAIIFSGTPGLIFFAATTILTGCYLFTSLFNRSFKKTGKTLVGLTILLCLTLPILYYMKLQTSSGYFGNIMTDWGYNTFRKEVYPCVFYVLLVSYGILPIFFIPAVMLFLAKPRFDRLFIFFVTMLPFVFYLSSVYGFLEINKIRFAYSAPYVFAGITATFGIMALTKLIKSQKYSRFFRLLIFLIFFINAVVGLAVYWKPLLNNGNNHLNFTNIYIPKKYIKALEFVDSHSTTYSHVLSTFGIGMYIPAFTHNKVFVGNESATMNFVLKNYLANQFFEGKMTSPEAEKLFTDYKIAYVLWDRGKLPDSYISLLTSIFSQDNVNIYKTRQNY